MKRSDIVLEIASQIVMEHVEIPWDKAQRLAEIILKQIEYNGMLPPYKSKDRQYPDVLTQHSWELEKDEN